MLFLKMTNTSLLKKVEHCSGILVILSRYWLTISSISAFLEIRFSPSYSMSSALLFNNDFIVKKNLLCFNWNSVSLLPLSFSSLKSLPGTLSSILPMSLPLSLIAFFHYFTDIHTETHTEGTCADTLCINTYACICLHNLMILFLVVVVLVMYMVSG